MFIFFEKKGLKVFQKKFEPLNFLKKMGQKNHTFLLSFTQN
jgi:hypothetical protein